MSRYSRSKFDISKMSWNIIDIILMTFYYNCEIIKRMVEFCQRQAINCCLSSQYAFLMRFFSFPVFLTLWHFFFTKEAAKLCINCRFKNTLCMMYCYLIKCMCIGIASELAKLYQKPTETHQIKQVVHLSHFSFKIFLNCSLRLI